MKNCEWRWRGWLMVMGMFFGCDTTIQVGTAVQSGRQALLRKDPAQAGPRPYPVHHLDLFPAGGDGELEGIGGDEDDSDEEKPSQYPLGETKDMDEDRKRIHPFLAVLNLLELRDPLQLSDHLLDTRRIPEVLFQLNFKRRPRPSPPPGIAGRAHTAAG